MRRLSIWNPWNMMRNDMMDEDFDMFDVTENEMDMYEEDDDVVIKVKAPGFDEDSLDITIQDGSICITGNMDEEKEEEDKKKKYYRKEIRKQSFTRRADLPVRIKPDKAEANFENGVLTLRLPKAEEEKPKTIKIKANKK